MKNTLKQIALGAMLAAGIAGCSSAQSKSNEDCRGYIKMEGQYWNLGKTYEHHHATHPNDRSFLSGDAGDTRIGGLGGFAIGGGISKPTRFVEPYADLSLLMVFGRDEHKNENDTRPDEYCSEIYSQAFPFSPQAAAGIKFFPKSRLSLGLEANGTLFSFESGWNRYNEDEPTYRSSKFLLNAGPRIFYRTEEVDITASFLKGMPMGTHKNESYMTSLSVNWIF